MSWHWLALLHLFLSLNMGGRIFNGLKIKLNIGLVALVASWPRFALGKMVGQPRCYNALEPREDFVQLPPPNNIE